MQEVIVTKNGHEVERFIPKSEAVSYLTDSLTGSLKGDYDLYELWKKVMKKITVYRAPNGETSLHIYPKLQKKN